MVTRASLELDDAFQSGFLPFLIGDTTKGLVAFREDRSGFVEADFPMLKSLDGLPVERWLDKAQLMVPAGSPQFVRRSSIRFLRFVGYLRGELALPVAETLRVELASESGARTKIVDIPLASKKPIYGIWPKTVHHLLPSDNIGYLPSTACRTMKHS